MERETFGLPRLDLPPVPMVTPQELERRREIGKQLDELRKTIGPLGITWEELDVEED